MSKKSIIKNTQGALNFKFLFLFFLELFSLFYIFAKNNKQTFKQSKSEIIQCQKDSAKRENATLVYKRVKEIQQNKIKVVDDFVNGLALEERICQLFIENLEGNTTFRPVEKMDVISSEVENKEKYIVPGGYLFFSFNVGKTPEQIMKFTDSIYDFCEKNQTIPPFLAIDQEGGYVNRLRQINGKLPSQKSVAEKYALEQAYQLYSLQAKQMKLLGFTMNLSPVIEVCTDENRDFIEDRSFGNLDSVLTYGKSCINAYEKNNIATVVKHFPGNTNTDPHTGLPEIKLSKDELEKSLLSFEELLKENPTGILMSHARTSEIDSETPACLSNIWITEILRNKYNYKGIIFSDDIFMDALAKNGFPPEKAIVMAIDAGIDCIMISEKRIGKAASVLYKKALEDENFSNKISKACKNLVEYKLACGLLTLTDNSEKPTEFLIVPVLRSELEYNLKNPERNNDNSFESSFEKFNRLDEFYKYKEKNNSL